MKTTKLHKTLILFLGAIVLLNTGIAAQSHIRNSNFEYGTGTNADGWTFTNSVQRATTYNAMVSSQNVTFNPPEGQYFLKLTTIGPDTNHALLGKAAITIPKIGYPDSIVLNAAYFPQMIYDRVEFDVEFLKYDSASHMSWQVSLMSFSSSTKEKWYKLSSGKIIYFGGEPDYDSLRISIYSAGKGQHNPQTQMGRWGIGTVLLADDMVFYGQNLTTSIDLSSAKAKVISVYPNPAIGKTTVNLNFPLTADAKLTLTDLQGKTIALPLSEENIGQHTFQLDVSMLKAGIYAGTIYTNNENETFRLVVGE